jgi:hypothetical protein
MRVEIKKFIQGINPVKHNNSLHKIFLRRHVSTFIKSSSGLSKELIHRIKSDVGRSVHQHTV